MVLGAPMPQPVGIAVDPARLLDVLLGVVDAPVDAAA
jgi:hypothetical protein